MKRRENLTEMRRLKVEERESVKYFVAVGSGGVFSLCAGKEAGRLNVSESHQPGL